MGFLNRLWLRLMRVLGFTDFPLDLEELHKHTGHIPDPPDSRDLKYAVREVRVQSLPQSVDQSPWNGPIASQIGTGSCVGQSSKSACEYLARRYWGKPNDTYSALYVYYNARFQVGTTNQDNGAMIRMGLQGMSKNGICQDKYWPYVAANVLLQPVYPSYEDGRTRMVSRYYRIDGDAQNDDLAQIKDALTQGYAVVLGFTTYPTLVSQKAYRTGIVDYPPAGMAKVSSHAIRIVGYDDTKSYLKFANSWSTYWGDKGFGYLPYAYVQNGLCSDIWAIKPDVVTGN